MWLAALISEMGMWGGDVGTVDTEGNKAKAQGTEKNSGPLAKLAPAKSGPKLIKVSMTYWKENANPGEDGSTLQSVESETEKVDDAGDTSKHVYCW